jgi:hypothetical protein
MLEFRIGDRVTFHPGGRPPVTGMLVRYNRKSVTVITDQGEHWTVAPSLLRRAESSEAGDQGKNNLIPFRK